MILQSKSNEFVRRDMTNDQALSLAIRSMEESCRKIESEELPPLTQVVLDKQGRNGGRRLNFDQASRFCLNKVQRVIDDYYENFLDLTEAGSDSNLVVAEHTASIPPECILLSLMSPQLRGNTDNSIVYAKEIGQQHLCEKRSEHLGVNRSRARAKCLYSIREFGRSLFMEPREFMEIICWEKDYETGTYWFGAHSILNDFSSKDVTSGKIKIMGMKLEPVSIKQTGFFGKRPDITGTKVTAILSIDPNVWLTRYNLNSHTRSLLIGFLKSCESLWITELKNNSSEDDLSEEINHQLFGQKNDNDDELSMQHSQANEVENTNKSSISQGNMLKKFSSMVFGKKSENLEEKPLTKLLLVMKEACDILSPLVQRIYENIHNDENTESRKADKSEFTIADGLVQELLSTYLLGKGTFKAVVGEEDSSVINITVAPYTVDTLQVPPAYFEQIDEARRQLSELSKQLEGNVVYKTCTVFIDPIDGTKPFVENKGEQCAIHLGVAMDGEAVAGLVYRPIRLDMSSIKPGQDMRFWAAGCKRENSRLGNLDIEHSAATQIGLPSAGTKGFISTLQNTMTKFLEETIEELGMERVKSGSVGNKVLCLLEGKATIYLQDRGTSRWDTCAPQAVIEAYGGILCKLSTFMNEDGKISNYQYVESDENTDLDIVFNDNNKMELRAEFSRFNSSDTSLLKTEINAENADKVKPYSNICGFVCLTAEEAENIPKYLSTLAKVAAHTPPRFC